MLTAKNLLFALALVAACTSCSTPVSIQEQGNTCVQERKSKLFGITLATEQNIVNCPE